MKSVEKSGVVGSEHGCQRFIEISQFLFIDVYKLREGYFSRTAIIKPPL